MVDQDQGGTFRQLRPIIMGPSIGTVLGPDQVILRVTNSVAVIPPGYNVVSVNFGGTVSLTLPKVVSASTAIGNPNAGAAEQLQIKDDSGNANTTTNLITINPASGDNIDGLSSITIASNYGTVILLPDPVLGNWRVSQ